MKRKYTVVANKGYDISDIDADMTSHGGSQHIPSREVEITQPHKMFKSLTEFLLTDEEAEELRNDPRVKEVGLSFEERDDLIIESTAIQYGDFGRSSSTQNDIQHTRRNWGLKRCQHRDTPYLAPNYDTTSNDENDFINYNITGHGVDIVVMDDDMRTEHPEFLDENGVSRVQKIIWPEELERLGYYEGTDDTAKSVMEDRKGYTLERYYDNDEANHGTPVAGTAAGNLNGWAKDAHIYFAKINLTGYFGTDFFYSWYDYLLYWHKHKNTGRPTVIIQSFGVNQIIPENWVSQIDSGVYRGEAWQRDGRTDAQIQDAYDIVSPLNRRIQANITGMYEIHNEMSEAGIHIVTGAGNSRNRVVGVGHPDYDNRVFIGNGTYYYARIGTPYGDDVLVAGALSHSPDNDKEKLIFYTARGPGVDIYAPGDRFWVAKNEKHTDEGFPGYSYAPNSTFEVMQFGGTSGACPQVGGVLALYAQVYPTKSAKFVKSKLLSDASVDKINEVSGGASVTDAFLDSNNKLLYSPFNVDIGCVYKNATHNASLNKPPKLRTTYLSGPVDIGFDWNLLNFAGVYRSLETNFGRFSNDSYSAINQNGIIRQFYQEKIGTNHYKYYLQVVGGVENTGWETVRWSERNNNYMLQRRDANFDEPMGMWTWELYEPTKMYRRQTYNFSLT